MNSYQTTIRTETYLVDIDRSPAMLDIAKTVSKYLEYKDDIEHPIIITIDYCQAITNYTCMIEIYDKSHNVRFARTAFTGDDIKSHYKMLHAEYVGNLLQTKTI